MNTSKSQLINALNTTANLTQTENGALAFKSTRSAVLDFFALGSAMRERSDADIITLFSRAWKEDPLLSMKAAFYSRDIRGGQGERNSFRKILFWLGQFHPEQTVKNLKNVVEMGRWDDLFSLYGSPCERDVIEMFKAQLVKDMENCLKGEPVSLLAKWLKSANTSSNESRRLAKKTAKLLGLSERNYRKTLSKLRAQTGIVEVAMSAGKWTFIKYQGVPSKAMTLYRKAFSKHDANGFCAYLKKVEKGEATINASTLYPYDIVKKCLHGEESKVLDLQWKALPDYVDGASSNDIVMADVSGSMESNGGLPIAVSISLAIYFAQRSEGLFKNHFITFSSHPELVALEGETISEIAQNLSHAQWDMTTDIDAAFSMILSAATQNRIPESEMPRRIFIVSDMQFDDAIYGGTNFDTMKTLYRNAGYELPTIVFWNVNARIDNVPVTANEEGVILVSGCSPSIFKNILAAKNVSPYSLMLETLNSERYKNVTV